MRIKNSQGFNLLHICETPLPHIVAFAVAAAAVAKIAVVEFAVAVVSVAAVAITPCHQEQKSLSTVRVPVNCPNYLVQVDLGRENLSIINKLQLSQLQ